VFILKNTSFDNCETTIGDGGAIYLKLKKNGGAWLSNCSFIECRCENYGGAIYILNDDGVNPFFYIKVFITFFTNYFI
jgi:hypothetical protein